MKNHITLVVHGGAGDISVETHQAHVEGCRHAVDAGWAILSDGGSAVDVVEAAVRVMEDDPTFDAGRGSVLNAAGDIEMDAIIMDGSDLNCGAVAAVQRVRHPVTLARLVMAPPPSGCNHVLLASAGAEAFARERDLPFCLPKYLSTEQEEKRWRQAQAETAHNPNEVAGPSDTVGAVALDVHGNLAVATSTGGTFNKHPGRVGDSPLVGCGAYADNRTGAVSATGEGEALMKVVISKTACDFMAQGMTAQEAADAAIAILAERTTGVGGLIVLDKTGDVGLAHNTAHIAHAYTIPGGGVIAGMRVTSANKQE